MVLDPGKEQQYLDLAHKAAALHQGECLSTNYPDCEEDTTLRWQCDAGHVFRDTLSSVKQGGWCPKCD